MSNTEKNSPKPGQKPNSLRTQMPETAALIDALRDAFGAEAINPSIKAGMAGQGGFYARENGIEVGTKPTGEWVPA